MGLHAPSSGSDGNTDAPRPMTPPQGLPALGSDKGPAPVDVRKLFAALQASSADVEPMSATDEDGDLVDQVDELAS